MADRGEQLSPGDLAMARATGKAFAEAMGTQSPERQLANFEKYEEHGEEFHIKPGTELPFMVLYNNETYEKKRLQWEYRSILSTARARKNEGGSVDSVTNPSPEERGLDPLGVEFKKERLEFLWREMPGMLAATCVYTQITAGKDFVGYMPGERKRRREAGEDTKVELESVRESLLGVKMFRDIEVDSADRKGKPKGRPVAVSKSLREWVKAERKYSSEELKKTGEVLTKGVWRSVDDLDHDELKKIYSESEVLDLVEEQKELAIGKRDKNNLLAEPACPDSVYAAKEPAFSTLRKSLRFFLKTKAVGLLFIDNEDREKVLNPDLDEYQKALSSEEFEEKKEQIKSALKVKELNFRAREAEQAAWNFIYTMGMIESNNLPDNNQYIREHHDKTLGPSNFMTLYLWMVMHPQIRFERKVTRKLDGGTDDAKENWSSLGSWAANNIQKGSWRKPVMDETTGEQKMGWELNLDETRKPILDTDGNETEVLRPTYETIIPKFIRPNLVYDALREETNSREVVFKYFLEKGELILRKPLSTGINHLELYRGLVVDRKIPKHKGVPTAGNHTWESLPDSPFVNYRFDRLRWANAIYTVFKKGSETKGKMAIGDFAEGARMLELTQQEVMNFLIMRQGIDKNRPDLYPAEGAITWNYALNTLRRNDRDLFANYGGTRTGVEDREDI